MTPNVLQFFSLISDGLGSVVLYMAALARQRGAMINYVSGKSQVSPKWESDVSVGQIAVR